MKDIIENPGIILLFLLCGFLVLFIQMSIEEWRTFLRQLDESFNVSVFRMPSDCRYRPHPNKRVIFK